MQKTIKNALFCKKIYYYLHIPIIFRIFASNLENNINTQQNIGDYDYDNYRNYQQQGN